jgi:hypothetical protein
MGRIVRLQSMDGGWAPFNHAQKPSQIHGVDDLRRVSDAIHRQCVALRQIQMAPTPELIELGEIFFIATRMAEALKSPEIQAHLFAKGPRAGMANLL